jgi:hypothetical protein
MRTSNISVSFPKAIRAILQTDETSHEAESSKHLIKRTAYQNPQVPGPGAYNIDKNWMEKGLQKHADWEKSRRNLDLKTSEQSNNTNYRLYNGQIIKNFL